MRNDTVNISWTEFWPGSQILLMSQTKLTSSRIKNQSLDPGQCSDLSTPDCNSVTIHVYTGFKFSPEYMNRSSLHNQSTDGLTLILDSLETSDAGLYILRKPASSLTSHVYLTILGKQVLVNKILLSFSAMTAVGEEVEKRKAGQPSMLIDSD